MNRNAPSQKKNHTHKTKLLSTWPIQENEHWKQTAAVCGKSDHHERNEFTFFCTYYELGKLFFGINT